MTRKSIDRLSKDLGRKRVKPTKEQQLLHDRAVRARSMAYEENRDIIEQGEDRAPIMQQFMEGGLAVAIPDRDILSGQSAFAADGLGPWGYRHDIYCSWCGSLQSCSWTWREIIEVLKGSSPMLLTSKGTCGHKMSFACNVGQPEVLLAVQKGWAMVEYGGKRVDVSKELLEALVVHEKEPT